MSEKPEAWLYYLHNHAICSLASLAQDGWQVDRSKMTATRDGREVRLFVIQSRHDADRLRGQCFSAVRVWDDRVPHDAERIALLMVR